MLVAVTTFNGFVFQPLVEDMFKLRARVFADRQGWDVTVEHGMEIDQFDKLDPTYLIGLDNDLNVISCIRLLQTTGPHMLADVFYAVLDGEPPLRSANIWESTRFCVDTERLRRKESNKSVSQATCELMIGMGEYAQNAGITDIVTVIDPFMNRMLKRCGAEPYDYIGKTVPMGRVSAMAALLDCTDERIQNIRNFAGIDYDVFACEDDVLKELEMRKHGWKGPQAVCGFANPEELRDYCIRQLEGAGNEGERQAAEALVRGLIDQFGIEVPDNLLQRSQAHLKVVSP